MKSPEIKMHDKMRLSLLVDKFWWDNQTSILPDEAKKLSIKLTSRKRFSRSNLVIRGDENFCRNFEELSTGYTSYFLRAVTVSKRGIYLHYTNLNDRKLRGSIRCNCVKGLRLEFEIPRADPENTYKSIMEYDEDRVLGKILRIWEYTNGEEHCLTVMEDGMSAVETREYVLHLRLELGIGDNLHRTIKRLYVNVI
ncbi:MAG: hypothetical protein LBR98_09415 [Syntrophomonadaceae bacterium]|jgi:hypothetical protein|nr:hypothetical protein [Syntrophomonadaceae bacterium]